MDTDATSYDLWSSLLASQVSNLWHKMDVMEMRMLKRIYGKSKKDKIRNDHFRENLEITILEDESKKSI